MNVLVNVCEGYIVCAFGALLLGLLQYNGEDPYRVIQEDGYALSCCAFANLKLKCGPEVSALSSLHWMKWQCVQFWIAAPLLALIGAITAEMQADGTLVTLLLSVLRAVSIIVALKALWTLYHAVMHKLKAHRPFMKFTAIKLVFLAIILNTLVLARIVDTPAMPVPDALCPQEWRADAMSACSVRYIYFIQIVEALGIFCLCLYFYSPAEFVASEAPGVHGRGESEADAAEDDHIMGGPLCGRCWYVLANAFAFWQVLVYWDIPPSQEALAKHSALELGLTVKVMGATEGGGHSADVHSSGTASATTTQSNADTLSRGSASGKAKSDAGGGNAFRGMEASRVTSRGSVA